MKRYVDMHLHTHFSDGTMPPAQVVKEAMMQGMQRISITDHDSTRGYLEAKKEADRWGIDLIPGVEITQSKFHILGYGIDVNSRELQDMLTASRELQRASIKERIKTLEEIGVPINYEMVSAIFPESRIGSLNVVITMLLDKKCREYNSDMNASDIEQKYFGKSGISKKEEREYFPIRYVIDTIHKANGKAVIAHPFRQVDNPGSLDFIIEAGLDGLEVQPNFGTRNIPFVEYSGKKGLFLTYGSDYHGTIFPHRPLLKKAENVIEDTLRFP